jgi:hypothetical protein
MVSSQSHLDFSRDLGDFCPLSTNLPHRYLADPNSKAKPADDEFLEMKIYGSRNIAIHMDMIHKYVRPLRYRYDDNNIGVSMYGDEGLSASDSRPLGRERWALS